MVCGRQNKYSQNIVGTWPDWFPIVHRYTGDIRGKVPVAQGVTFLVVWYAFEDGWEGSPRALLHFDFDFPLFCNYSTNNISTDGYHTLCLIISAWPPDTASVRKPPILVRKPDPVYEVINLSPPPPSKTTNVQGGGWESIKANTKLGRPTQQLLFTC